MLHHHTSNIEIKRLTSESAADAFSLACEVFVDASVLHSATGVTIEEYQNYMNDSFDAMWRQGLSLVACNRQTNELIGCLVACDYLTQGQNLSSIPDRLKPVNALLNRLDEMYQEFRDVKPAQCMLVDMAVVSPAARGKGIYKKLREAVHKIGREEGFSVVVGELSSAATQALCVNQLQHKICAEIEYSSFMYEDHYPFSAIKTPRSIVLTEGKL